MSETWRCHVRRACVPVAMAGAAILALGCQRSTDTAEAVAAVTAPPTTAATAVAPATTTTLAPTTTLPPVAFTVGAVVDGDTIDVVASDGSPGTRVRIIGIDAPEQGACEAAAATALLTQLVAGQPVVLTLGIDGEDLDRYGRSLRHVDVLGIDAGLRLIEDGVAVARYDSRDGYGAHAREAAYVAADAASPDVACTPPTTVPPPTVPPTAPPAPQPAFAVPAAASACDPNYSGCVPIDSDVDCAGGSGNGPTYTGRVDVIGVDVYELDRDADGVGCD